MVFATLCFASRRAIKTGGIKKNGSTRVFAPASTVFEVFKKDEMQERGGGAAVFRRLERRELVPAEESEAHVIFQGK